MQNEKDKKGFSITILTYDMEKYLSACLDSATDKFVNDRFEVIVVNKIRRYHA